MADEETANADSSQNESGVSERESELLKKIEALEAELQKTKSEHLYLAAEFDTYRRRSIKERSDFMKYAGERAFVEFLDIYDNIQRALETPESAETAEAFRRGVKLISEEFRSAFEKLSVNEVPAEGQPFDPNVHEALGSEERDDLAPEHVSRVFKKPYKLHDKLIRPGQVIVSKAPSQTSES